MLADSPFTADAMMPSVKLKLDVLSEYLNKLLFVIVTQQLISHFCTA
jgi:hypothetical protein